MSAEFDTALITAAFSEAAAAGWSAVTVVGAARAAGLPLDEARTRFPGKAAILLRLGQHADTHTLAGPPPEGTIREQLFDLLMRRFDALQPHRAGIEALLRALPFAPATALLLADATRRSMTWMLQAAGADTSGAAGALRVSGLVAVWTYTVRAWLRDESGDLAATMAALDRGLGRAEQAAGWLSAPGPAPRPPAPFPDVAAEPPATAI